MFDVKFNKINFPLKLKLFKKKKNHSQEGQRFILFPDEPAGNEKIADSFKRESVAQEVAYAVKTSEGQMNFLISGEWGLGKTSILNLIEKRIEDFNIQYLWFSPWKYSGSKEEANAISRVFLTILAEKLGRQYLVRDLYIKKQVENERNLVTQIVMLLQLIIVYSVYISIIFLTLSLIGPFLSTNIPLLQQIITTLGEAQTFGLASAFLALPPLGQYFVTKIREQGETEQISSPELFEIKFRSLIERTIKFRKFQRILNFFEETFSKTWLFFLGHPLTNIVYKFAPFKLKKLVIFIDDLDRCTPPEVTEFLSGMKTFLERPQVYYVVAADMGRLRKKVEDEDPEVLRKIIQLDWNVPPLLKSEIKEYTDKLLEVSKAKDAFTSSEREELYSMFQLHPNPRKIKYYLRRLLFEMNLERAKAV